MPTRLASTWRGLALALGLTPAVFLLNHWGPSGMPLAEGCIGGGTSAPPILRITREPGVASYSVATDGFFVLNTNGLVDPAPRFATTKVSVTTLEGAKVAGKIITIAGQDLSYLAWQADAPLSIGTKLKVVAESPAVTGAPVAPDEVRLDVTGEPALLEAGTVSFDTWLDNRRGVGQTVSCTSIPSNSCRQLPPVLTVFTAEQRLPAVEAAWQVGGNPHGFTLWEVVVAAKDPAIDAVPSFVAVVEPAQRHALSPLVFAAPAASHCVTVVVKDLRTGAVKSAEQCAPPATPSPEASVRRDYPLESCDAPPSSALTPAWCEATRSDLPLCHEAKPGPTSGAADGPSGPSSGCQVALVGASAAGGTFFGFSAVVGVLSLLSRRRARASD
jgi:hypothetical protein